MKKRAKPARHTHAWKTTEMMTYPQGHQGPVCRIESCACGVKRTVRWRDGFEPAPKELP